MYINLAGKMQSLYC